MKKELYDIVVELPNSSPRRWPNIKTSSGEVIKATQRDLRRWRSLQHASQTSKRQGYTDEEHDRAVDDEDDEGADLLPRLNSGGYDESEDTSEYDPIIEPTSWSALAYNGFIWWASAGERDVNLDQEAEQDAQLNGDLEHAPAPQSPTRYEDESDEEDAHGEVEETSTEVDSTLHMELLAYFHRYTHQILTAAASAIDSEAGTQTDGQDDQSDEEVTVGDDDLRRMGLDAWSEHDRKFVIELMEKYFGRRAVVKGAGIECCGIRIG